jgi:hypothetical protein
VFLGLTGVIQAVFGNVNIWYSHVFSALCLFLKANFKQRKFLKKKVLIIIALRNRQKSEIVWDSVAV